MKKQKTRKELEDSKTMWIIFTIMGWGVLLMLIIGLVLNNQTAKDFQDLETKLSECQDKVEVWTLKVECQYPLIDFYHYSERNYTNYEDYLEGRQRVIDFENCEVVSDE